MNLKCNKNNSNNKVNQMQLTKQNVLFLINELETLNLVNLTEYANNAAAVAGGLIIDDVYINSTTKALTIVTA